MRRCGHDGGKFKTTAGPRGRTQLCFRASTKTTEDTEYAEAEETKLRETLALPMFERHRHIYSISVYSVVTTAFSKHVASRAMLEWWVLCCFEQEHTRELWLLA